VGRQWPAGRAKISAVARIELLYATFSQCPSNLTSLPHSNGSRSSVAFNQGLGNVNANVDTPLPRVGNHRLSTITVRLSDGWFSMVLTSLVGGSSSLPPSSAPNQTAFGIQHPGSRSGSNHDLGRIAGRSSSNVSKASLPPPLGRGELYGVSNSVLLTAVSNRGVRSDL
jgi:hypothetical protein